MKPRILFVVQLPPPLHGVTTINQCVVTSDVIASKFDLDVVPLQFSSSVEELRSASVRKLARAVSTGLRLGWRLASHRPDAVYYTVAPSGAAFYRDCIYIALCKALRVPRIFHMHARGIAERDGAGSRALHRWIFRDARVIHLSPHLEADTRAFVAPDDVLYVANGVEDVPGAGTRPSHGSRPRILFVSNMIREKGPLDLIEALGVLAKRGIDFEATFAGARFHDGCIEAFEAAVHRLGLGDRVSYVGPTYDTAKLDLFRTHDIFAFPTYRDAFPLVVLEAMRHALPVVSTHEGAIDEIVEDGTTGYLVEKRDIQALANRLDTLVGDAALRMRLGAAGRARYLERYTAKQFEENLALALAQCVAAPT